jgi:L-fuconolactonase
MANDAIIDAHVHLWDTRNLNYPWLKDQPVLARPFLPPDLDAAVRQCNVESVVIVEAACDPQQVAQEVRWLHTLAQAGLNVGAIVANAPVERGEAIKAILDEHARCPLLRGIRRIIASEPPGFCTAGDFLRGLELVAEQGWSFDINVRSDQLPDAAVMVRQCPSMRFVLDHIGFPDIAAGVTEPWESDLRRLSESPNVWCKLSGMVTRAAPSWTAADLRPYLQHVLDCFGPDRVMFGSDWPVVTRMAQLSDWLQTLRSRLAEYGPTEQQRMFRRNAARFYRLAGETNHD